MGKKAKINIYELNSKYCPIDNYSYYIQNIKSTSLTLIDQHQRYSLKNENLII